MKNKILVIDTRSKLNPLESFFEELSNRETELHFLLNKNNDLNGKYIHRKNRLLLPIEQKKPCRSFLLYLFYPLYFFYSLFYLLYFKTGKKIKVVVCVGCFEKIIFTPAAKLLGLKNIWLEIPGEKNFEFKRTLARPYVLISRLASLITFSRYHEKELLKKGIRSKNLKVISPGIKLNSFRNQDNIFNQIAENDYRNFSKKFFTIGTVVDLNEPQRIEILFQAIKKCLTVIHHLQLIVIGDGSERKNLAWLSKKMEIDNMVWFVGEQKNARRWFDNFDIYVVSSEKFGLIDINPCLAALAAGLPVIGPDDMGVDDLIVNEHSGLLVEPGNSEPLAQAIIKLQQNKAKRKELGQNAVLAVETKNNLVSMVEKFAKIANLD